VAKNPDPSLALSTSKGITRSLDDWSTMFQLCMVILPDRPESAQWIPVAQRIFDVLGDSDVRTSYVVTGSAQIAQRILGEEEDRVATFVDPDRVLVKSLGLERLPALVFLRQDTTVGAAAEGWDPVEWQDVARTVSRAMKWSVPEIAPPGSDIPAVTGGWPV
jgi:hypothetical protein